MSKTFKTGQLVFFIPPDCFSFLIHIFVFQIPEK